VEIKRPGVVTFIGVLLYIKAALAAVGSIAAWVTVGSDAAASAGISDSALQQAGIAEAIAAVLLFIAAWYLMSGSNGARLVVAVVVGIRLVLIVWIMLTHHTGGYLFLGLISAGFAIFILWALYGDEKANEYFEAIG
jgi:hypothetical protein